MKEQSRKIALCGVSCALAVTLLLLGGILPLATFCAPMLAMAVLLPVRQECGTRMASAAYGAAAILALIEKQKMIAEGAGAVSVAAAMFHKFPLEGKKVVSLISGGNIDVTSLSRVIDRGLMKSGRTTNLLIELADKPGQLMEVSRIIAQCGGNVISVHHERNGETESINGCYLRLTLETRNYDHVQQITQALKDAGFKIV